MADKEHLSVKKVEAALRESKGFVTFAAKKLGCTYQTVYNYIKRHQSLQAVMEAVSEEVLDFSESKLFTQINEGNTTAIIFHLKCKGKKRGYIDRQTDEKDDVRTINIRVQKYDDWTDDELAEYVKTGIKPDRFKS
jgi:hypothetical protein